MEKAVKLIKEIRGQYVILDVDILGICKLKKTDTFKLFDLIRKEMDECMYYELDEYNCEKYKVPIGTYAYTMEGFAILNIYLDFDVDAVFTIFNAFAKKEKYVKVSTAQLNFYKEVIERQFKQMDDLENMLEELEIKMYGECIKLS